MVQGSKEEITISLINADIGSFPGHSRIHPLLLETAYKKLKEEGKAHNIIDYFVTHCGDNLELILTHRAGVNNHDIHTFAWAVFEECAKEATPKMLYGIDKDIENFNQLFTNIRGSGAGIAEIQFVERKSDPILCFMSDKTEPGAWNYFLYKIFADPFNTSGLVLEPEMKNGFTFEVYDAEKKISFYLETPKDSYRLLALIGTPSRYMVKSVSLTDTHGTEPDKREKAASISTPISSKAFSQKNNEPASYKDEPVMIVRAQQGFPAVGEILEPFAAPIIVAGWMRGSHFGPFMPVGLCDANCTRFDGPPRVVCFGFQVAKGQLVGPVDMFDDPAFDRVRARCNELADILRSHGPFEPHRLPLEELEPKIQKRMKEVGEEIKRRRG